MKPLPVLVGAALLLAGCTAPPSDEPAVAPGATVLPPTFALEASGCDEGGSYVTWNAFPGDRNFPPPFTPVDVSDDVGNPPTTSLGGSPQDPASEPWMHLDVVPGPTVTGAYHALVRCETWSLDGTARQDLWLGFVGARVAPPPFDPAPVDREYVVGVVGVADPDLAARMAAAGFHVEALSGLDLSLAGGSLRQAMRYDHHGDILAAVPLGGAGPKPAETIRLWTLVAVDEDHLRPLALDLVDAGGERYVASAPGLFEHTTTGPAPAVPGSPIHTFSSWALAYQGVERTFRPGPATEVVLDVEGHGHQAGARG